MSDEECTNLQNAEKDISRLKYPRQTSEWGRSLIDLLNVRFDSISSQIKCMNDNMDDRFVQLKKDIDDIKTTANEAKSLAMKNRNDINDLRSELNNLRSETNYLKFSCDDLIHENTTLRQKTVNL